MLLTAGTGLSAIGAPTGALAELSEIDGFEQALNSGTAEGALDFVAAFPSSHLVNDLFELLPPDIAAAACAGLPNSAGSAAHRACENLKEAISIVPAAGTPAAGVLPAAGEAVEEEATTTSRAVQSKTLSSDDSTSEPADDNSKHSPDKDPWLLNSTTEDTSADATLKSRRDGITADTESDSADDAPDSTADTADTDDTSAAEEGPTDEASPVAGSANEDGGSVTAGAGGNGSDGGTGGSTNGGGEVGGGGR
jgi:hypothetical protein